MEKTNKKAATSELLEIQFNTANFKWTLHQMMGGNKISTEIIPEFAKTIIDTYLLKPKQGENKEYTRTVNADTHIIYFSF